MSFRILPLAGLIAAFTVGITGASLSAQSSPKLSLEQTSAVRCAAAFALVAQDQARGNTEASQYPELGERGREFFVRIAARLMDETGADRAIVADLMQSEAQKLQRDGNLSEVMQPCLFMLEASGI
ncbi:MAG: hypothetical protein WAT93_14180 [Pontixanthobacter sp.]